MYFVKNDNTILNFKLTKKVSQLNQTVEYSKENLTQSITFPFNFWGDALYKLIPIIYLMFLVTAQAELPSYLSRPTQQTEFETTLQQAKQGDVKAQVRLGLMYHDGKGVSRNYAEAVNWYRLAAIKGDAEAQSDLAVMYYDGKGVSRDYAEAVNWFRQAAKKNYAVAQFNLGYLYETGQGVERDSLEAAKWYRLAAGQGYSKAQIGLNRLRDIEEATLSDDLRRKREIEVETLSDNLRRNSQIEKDRYKAITVSDFALDANTMKMGDKLKITGYYHADSQLESIIETPAVDLSPNAYRLFFISEDSSREARKTLLALRANQACYMYSACGITILGHVSECSIDWLGSKVRIVACVSVEEIQIGR